MNIDIYGWRLANEAFRAISSSTMAHQRIEMIHRAGEVECKLWLDEKQAGQLIEALEKLYPALAPKIEPVIEIAPPEVIDALADEHAAVND